MQVLLGVPISVSVEERGRVPEDGPARPLDQVPLGQIVGVEAGVHLLESLLGLPGQLTAAVHLKRGGVSCW